MPPKDNFQAAIPFGALAGMIYSSPLDFTAVYQAADRLAITFPAGAGYVPADANDILWIGIRYTNAAGQDVFLDNTAYNFDYTAATGHLVVTPSPGFPAVGGSFQVSLLGPPRESAVLASIDSLVNALNLQAALGLPGSYSSLIDFTAAYHDADELDLTGMPGLPSKAQFISVVEKVAGTIRRKWVAGIDRFEWDSANKRLQIVGATLSSAASAEWIVTYIGQVKAHDSVLNANQVVRLDAHQWDWVDSQMIFDAQALTTPGPDASIWYNGKGEVTVGLFIIWTTGAAAGAYTLDVGFNINDTDAGTNQYIGLAGDFEYPTTPAAPVQTQPAAFRLPAGVQSQTYYHSLRFKIKSANRFQITLTEGIPGANHITATVYMVIVNS